MSFIAHLFEIGLAPASISAHMAAISFWHELHQWVNPVRHPLVQKLLMGARNSRPSSFSRSPITVPMLRWLLQVLSHPSFSSYQSVLLSAVFTLAFYAFLRVGEFTVSPHTLQLADWQLSPGTSLLISFRSFKFSCNSSPHLILPAAKHDLCPVTHFSRYLSLRPPGSGPIFLCKSGQPLTSKLFSHYLTLACLLAGFDHTAIKPHSFCIGAATTAAALGIPSDTIQAMGRWSSQAFRRYIRVQINRL